MINIFKTFEIFLREPISIFKNKIIQIVGVNSAQMKKAEITVDMLDKKTQITVINSTKMYNLLSTVQAKREKKIAQELLSATHNKVVIGQLCKRT